MGAGEDGGFGFFASSLEVETNWHMLT